jgi:hypothetical protein
VPCQRKTEWTRGWDEPDHIEPQKGGEEMGVRKALEGQQKGNRKMGFEVFEGFEGFERHYI